MPLRSCLKRTEALHPRAPPAPDQQPSPCTFSLSLALSTGSTTSTTITRTVRFSPDQAPVYTTHSASEYDRRPAGAARCGRARLLGASVEEDGPPAGSGAGDAWSRIQAATTSERDMAAATDHPDVHGSVDAAFLLGAARLMGPCPTEAETVDADDRSDGSSEPVRAHTTSDPCPSPATDDEPRAVSHDPPEPEVHPSDALDSASCVSDSSCDTASDTEETQVVSVFSLRGEEHAIELPRIRRNPHCESAPALGKEGQGTAHPTLVRGTRAPPHPEVESGWGQTRPSVLTRAPAQSQEWERERAMLGMGAHRQARLDRRAHAQRVCLMARLGLLDRPRTPLPGSGAAPEPTPTLPVPPLPSLGPTQPIYDR